MNSCNNYSNYFLFVQEILPSKEVALPDPVLLEAKANLEQAAALEPSDSDGLGGTILVFNCVYVVILYTFL